MWAPVCFPGLPPPGPLPGEGGFSYSFLGGLPTPSASLGAGLSQSGSGVHEGAHRHAVLSLGPCPRASSPWFRAALSPFSRTAGRVLRGTGGGKRSGRHLSCSQLGWKCTVSSVLIRRCLNHPQGQLSICEDQTMTCVGSTVSVVVWMSFSSLPQIHVPLCPSFLTWTLSSFPPDTSGF